jgi:alpha-beta hydrolase superfamily lysophospholipase
MRRRFRSVAIGMLATAIMLALGLSPGMAQSHPHVYLFRGLADVFSTGMDTLADELNKRGVPATSHSHTDWKEIADKAAADYKAKKERPIILIGHSLGADAAMEMADYLGDKGIPVALVVPFDGTQSFPAPGNVARVINFTQRDYAYMRPGPGFRGSLNNIDLSSDPDLNHLNIDKSPKLHARVIREVLAVVGGNRMAAPAPASTKPSSINAPARSSEVPATAAPAGENKLEIVAPRTPTDIGDLGTPIIAPPESSGESKSPAEPALSPPPQKPVLPPRPINPAQIPD